MKALKAIFILNCTWCLFLLSFLAYLVLSAGSDLQVSMITLSIILTIAVSYLLYTVMKLEKENMK